MFVIRGMTKIVPEGLFGGFYPLVYLVCVFVFASIAAIVSYRLIEKPSNDGLRTRMGI